MAVKVEDGGGIDRATWAVSIEALRLAGILEGQALRLVGRYHLTVVLDPHGRIAAETIPGSSSCRWASSSAEGRATTRGASRGGRSAEGVGRRVGDARGRGWGR